MRCCRPQDRQCMSMGLLEAHHCCRRMYSVPKHSLTMAIYTRASPMAPVHQAVASWGRGAKHADFDRCLLVLCGWLNVTCRSAALATLPSMRQKVYPFWLMAACKISNMTRDWLKIRVLWPLVTSSGSSLIIKDVLHEVSTPALPT